MAEKFGQMRKDEVREERKTINSDSPQSCVCIHVFAFCKFCQDQGSDTDHHYDDDYTLPNLTEEEVK